MRYYEDLSKLSENRLPQRSYYIPSGISKYTSLNGIWKFKYYSKDIDYDKDNVEWGTIDVPSCWQTRGFENPNYTNINYPYSVDLPFVPDENPCGVYEREFEIEDTKMMNYIVFEGVSSDATIWINGKYLGYTQGSHLQAEFDISKLVKSGTNIVRVLVHKWCCGSYLEDQDQFRHNGIFRDVYLLSRPKKHITDIFVKTKDNKTVIADFDGKAKVSVFDGNKILARAVAENHVEFTLDAPKLWNAEEPNLYTIRFEKDKEVINIRFGFRIISISDKKELLINGTAVKLKGVNHHDTHPLNGWCLTKEDILKDLTRMKMLNINTIRTSHYPPHPEFVSLCDELGFYLVLENDIETHGFYNRTDETLFQHNLFENAHPNARKDCEKMFFDRMTRTVERDKNHPAVIMWSAGNESEYGINHKNIMLWTKQRDPQRLTHYEGARNADPDVLDVFSVMYPELAWLKERTTDPEYTRPIFLCEYSHAMGNGPGDVCDYWEMIYDEPQLIGGCIWEWTDHTVIVNGMPTYGGDFKEPAHDGNFCCDGLTFNDRSFKAGSLEAKTAYQPMWATWENGKLTVRNRFDFTSFDKYTFYYELVKDKKTVKGKNIKLTNKPHETVTVDLPLDLPSSCKYGWYINIYMKDKNGYVLASNQSALPVPVEKKEETKISAKIKEDEKNIYFEGNGFRYTLSKLYGGFISLVMKDKEQLTAPLVPTVMRALIDNESVLKYNICKEMHLDKGTRKIYETKLEGDKVLVYGSFSGMSKVPSIYFNIVYTVNKAGKINIATHVEVSKLYDFLQRFGFTLTTAHDNDKFSYFGMGPTENYCDLSRHAKMGFYESDAKKEFVPYIRPQEHGNHTRTKEFNLASGLTVTAENDFEFMVSHYSTKNLMDTKHCTELVDDDATFIRIDYKDSGVGSRSCGPKLQEKYQLNEKVFDYTFSISMTK